jgi:hypothetical protein
MEAIREIKSFSLEFWFQYRRVSPWMSPLKQLVGYADKGGMYKYKFVVFWKVLVWIVPLLSEISRSRKEV